MSILHIDTSPKGTDSVSRRISGYLAGKLNRGENLIYRDLAEEDFPPLSPADLVAVHGSRDDGTAELQRHKAISDTLIQELFAADRLVMGVSMHNFSVPAVLKRWIDYVARAGVTFRYTGEGPVGLTNIDTAYLVIATGGTPVGGDMDFASGYLAHICRFLGVRNVHIVDGGGSKRKTGEIIDSARAEIDLLLSQRYIA